MSAPDVAAVLDDDGIGVEIRVDGHPVGRARWTGWRLVDRPTRLGVDPGADEQSIYAALEADLSSRGEAEVAALSLAAYDREGVDRSLIRWMLGLSPLERLRTMDEHNRSLARVRGGSVR